MSDRDPEFFHEFRSDSWYPVDKVCAFHKRKGANRFKRTYFRPASSENDGRIPYVLWDGVAYVYGGDIFKHLEELRESD